MDIILVSETHIRFITLSVSRCTYVYTNPRLFTEVKWDFQTDDIKLLIKGQEYSQRKLSFFFHTKVCLFYSRVKNVTSFFVVIVFRNRFISLFLC